MEHDLKRRLRALRATLVEDPTAALEALDGWLAELGEAPQPSEPPPPLFHVEGDPSVAILMPTYQRADLIEETLDCLLNQTAADFLLVVCDDGSTDGTPDILEAAAARDPRVRVLKNGVNRGRPFTRNRLIYASDAEFILWMDDDDVLDARALEIYLQTLAEHPETDVIYGDLQIFDHDTGEDLNLYQPNDWTGATDRLVAGKLYGSCIPNGGTFVRRSILTQVGGYDLDFPRAQDYEIWTRVAHLARFRKIPHTLYRYRKHSGCVSFGDEIDLSYDSVIVRRHLARHPWPKLFLTQDPDLPDWTAIHLQMAKLMRLYEDPYNALRFLDAAHRPDPEVEEAIFEAKLVMGVDPTPWIAGVDARRALLGEARRLEAAMEAQIEAGETLAARQTLARHRQLLQRTVKGSLALARIFELEGDLKAAAKAAAAATRINPHDEAAAAIARRLDEAAGGALDLDAMRARLLSVYNTPRIPPVPPAHEGLISVVLLDPAGRAAVEAQEGVEVEIVDALEHARGDLIAFLEAGARWSPDHLARLAALEGPLRLSGHISGGARRIKAWDRGALMVDEVIPLSACLWAREAIPEIDAEQPRWGWDLLLRAGVERPAHTGDATCLIDHAPEITPRGLARLYEAHPIGLDVELGAARAARAARIGVGLPRLGRGALVVLLPEAPEAATALLEGIARHTLIPHQLIIVADGPSEALREALSPWEARIDRFAVNPRPLGLVKAINQGLSLADGACVTLLSDAAPLEEGWLGRRQLEALSNPKAGVYVEGAWTWTQAALERVGGLDTGLSRDAAFVDYRRRLALAGFEVLGAPSHRGEDDPALRARWLDREGPFDPARDHHPLGNEPGYRPDTPPLRVEEAAALNLLACPPEDEAAWPEVLGWLEGAPEGDWAIWWRVAPGGGAEALPRLERACAEAGVPASARVLIIDARLSPDREAALYVTADGVLVDEAWPNAELERRRATDCGREVIWGREALRARLSR